MELTTNFEGRDAVERILPSDSDLPFAVYQGWVYLGTYLWSISGAMRRGWKEASGVLTKNFADRDLIWREESEGRRKGEEERRRGPWVDARSGGGWGI